MSGPRGLWSDTDMRLIISRAVRFIVLDYCSFVTREGYGVSSEAKMGPNKLPAVGGTIEVVYSRAGKGRVCG